MQAQGGQIYFLVALVIAVFALVLLILKPFFAPLTLAAVFAVVFYPLYVRIRASMPSYPSIASLLTVLIVCILIIALVSIIGVQLFAEVQHLYESIASTGSITALLPQKVTQLIEIYAPAAIASFDATAYLKAALTWLIGNLDSIFSGASRTALETVIFLIALYYLLKDGQRFVEKLIAVSPLEDADDAEILARLQNAVSSVLKGSIIVALIQGTLTAIGFTIFGVPSPMLWGTVAAVAALVPGLGTALVTGPAVILLLIQGATAPAIGLAIWGTVAVGMVDNLLGPRLMSHGIRMHPLLMLLSVLGGLALFGPIGFLVGPLALALFFALIEIVTDRQVLLS